MSVMKMLSDYEKKLFRIEINELYSLYLRCNKPKLIAKILLVWFFEFFTGCVDVTDSKNTNRTITNLLQKVSILYGRNITKLIGILHKIRNQLAHNPYLNILDIEEGIDESLLNANEEETIKLFCSVFEEDMENFIVIYKDIMETLDVYKQPETENKNTLKDYSSMRIFYGSKYCSSYSSYT